MSISADRFGSVGLFRSVKPSPAESARVRLYQVQCHNCSYDRWDPVNVDGTCPKCGGHAWDRFVRPGSILANAERYLR
jgi:hypothetical protein